jgi:hypothetical protein
MELETIIDIENNNEEYIKIMKVVGEKVHSALLGLCRSIVFSLFKNKYTLENM